MRASDIEREGERGGRGGGEHCATFLESTLVTDLNTQVQFTYRPQLRIETSEKQVTKTFQYFFTSFNISQKEVI